MWKGKRFTAITVTMCMLMSPVTALANGDEGVSPNELPYEEHYEAEALNTAAAEKAFHVAIDGSDKSGDGSEMNPFQSIERARDEVRKFNQDMTQDIKVILHAGTYELAETVRFDSRDSASNGYHIVYEATEGEQPVISGGRKITGWTEFQDGIYKTNVGDLRFRQLYVNDTKAVRARTPNAGEELPRTGMKTGNWTGSTEGQDLRLRIDSKLANGMQARDGAEAIIFSGWAESYVRLTDFTADGTTTFANMKQEEKAILSQRLYPWLSPSDPYYLENDLSFLDLENEWYLNNETGDLYYKPAGSIEDMDIIAPAVETLWEMEGTYDEPIENMEVRGIEFKYSTWLRPNDFGQIDMQAGQYNIKEGPNNQQWVGRPKAAVYTACTTNLIFERNRLNHLGATALDLHYGTRSSEIIGNVISDISGNGITAAVFSHEDVEHHNIYNPEESREINRDDLIANNYITRIGTDYYGTVGIAAGFPQGLTVRNNLITKLPYTGISVGWGWTNQSSAMQYNYIGYNEISYAMGELCDGGGIYTISNQPNSQIVNNYIHDIYGGKYPNGLPMAAIYLDEGTLGYEVRDNVLENIGPGVKRIHRNATQNQAFDNSKILADVIQNAGIQQEYADILQSDADTKQVILDSVTPESVVQGARVTLSGSGFGSNKGNIKIISDGLVYTSKDTAIDVWSDTQIQAAIPAHAAKGKAKIYVVTSEGGKSRYQELEICEADPVENVTEDFESYENGSLPSGSAGIWETQTNASVETEEDNRILKLTSNGANAAAKLAPVFKDFEMSFDMRFDTNPSRSEGLYMSYRASDSDYYRLEYLPGYGQKFNLAHGGVRLASNNDVSMEVQKWYSVKLNCIGSTMCAKIWEKGADEPEEWAVAVNDASLNDGQIELSCYFSSTNSMSFDNIRIQSITDEPEDDTLGKPKEIHFDDSLGSLPEKDWKSSVTCEVVEKDGDNVLKMESNRANAIALLKGDYQNFDMTFDMQFDGAASSPDSGLYLSFRGKDAGAYYGLHILPNANESEALKLVSQNVGYLYKGSIPSPKTAWYTVKLSCNGTAIKAKIWIKGEEEPDWQFQVEDNRLDMGYIEFAYYANQKSSLYIDNILLEKVNFDVVSNEKEMVSVADSGQVYRDLGTRFSLLGLPEFVSASLDNGTTAEDIRIVWEDEGYQPRTTSNQVLTGTLKTPYQIKNTKGLKAEVMVMVTDKPGLRKLLENAGAKLKEVYTEESYTNLENAVSAAQPVAENPEATDVMVEEQIQTLIKALDNLEPLGTMESLQTLIQESQSLLAEVKDVLYAEGEPLYDGYYAKDKFDLLSEETAKAELLYQELSDVLAGSEDQILSDEDLRKVIAEVPELQRAADELNASKVIVIRSGLVELIQKAENQEELRYTLETWKLFVKEWDHAKNVLELERLTQTDVDQAADKLFQAMQNLTERANKKVLEERLSEAKGIMADGYTPESYMELRKAIHTAQEVWDNSESSQQEVDAQSEGLLTAIRALIKVMPLSLTEAAVSKIPQQKYTGQQLQPEFTVTCKGKVLQPGSDYEAAYRNNTNIGKASILITGRGAYGGSITVPFEIVAAKGQTHIVGDYQYFIMNDKTDGKGTVSVSGFAKHSRTSVEIPDNVNIGSAHYKVVEIGSNAFKNQTGITKVSIGKNVKSIGSYAFYNCKKLTRIRILSSHLNSVGKNALKGIPRAARMEVPSAKADAYRKMFKRAGKPGNVEVKRTLVGVTIKSIADQKYTGKEVKPTLRVKDGNKTLKEGKDYRVTYSNNKKLGKACATVSGNGSYTGRLSKTFYIVAVKGSTCRVGKYKYKVTNARTDGLGTVTVTGSRKKTLTSIKIADTVKLGSKTYRITEIGESAFKANTRLSRVFVGKNVKKIGNNAFQACRKLKNVTIASTKLKTVGKDAWKGIHTNAVIKVPASHLKAYKNLMKGQSGKVKVTA